jgi:hypothetical protein
MHRRFVFYLKDNSRGIVITDKNPNKTVDELTKDIARQLSTSKFCVFKTETDCLIVNPFSISAIHIQGSDAYEFHKGNKSKVKVEEPVEIQSKLDVPDLDIEDVNDDNLVEQELDEDTDKVEYEQPNSQDDTCTSNILDLDVSSDDDDPLSQMQEWEKLVSGNSDEEQ